MSAGQRERQVPAADPAEDGAGDQDLASAASGPRFFASEDGPLFGWYHAPRPGDSAPAVLLCPPFGYEAICVHRAYRHLAERLAAAGSPVLRFDYHGTGDSAGCDRDPGRVAAWRRSLSAAIEELQRSSGRREVALFGLRLGATLAATVAAERRDVSALILWAPVSRGRLYVRELRAFRLMSDKELGPPPPGCEDRGEGDEEVAGYLLTQETCASISSLDLLAQAGAPAPRALLIARDDLPGDEAKLADRLAHLGVEVSRPSLPGYASMMQDPHKSAIPSQAFEEVTRWLGTIPPGLGEMSDSSTGEPARSPPAVPLRAHQAAPVAVRETPLRLPGPEGASLFAVLTEPTGPRGPGPHGPTALFLNAGAIHRVGPNRLWVSLARAWAERGITSVRLDLSGLGDSPPGAGGAENKIYSTQVVSDVRAVMRTLAAERGLDRFLLTGLCAGAYVAYHTGLIDPAVAGQILINPQTFYFREGDPLEVAQRRTYRETRHYQRQLRNLESWKKLLGGGVNLRYVAEMFAARGRDLAVQQGKRLLDRIGLGDPDPVALRQGFQGLSDRGVQTFLVFSDEDPGLEYLRTRLGPQLKRLLRSPALRLEVIEGPDHTFTPLWTQRSLSELLTAHVLGGSAARRA